MADKSTLSVEVPGVDFRELAREAIATRLTEAFLGHEDLIRKIVVAAMERKVNDRGEVPQRSYEEKLPFVEWLAEDMLRKATIEVLRAKIDSLRPIIEKEVEAALKRGAKASAKVLAESLARQAASGYGFSAEIIIKAKEPR